MKNIKILVSFALLVCVLASCLVFAGCSDPHAGHDHGDGVDLSVLTPLSKITRADSYPTISAYKTSDVKKKTNSTGALILYVIKHEGNQLYCTNNNSDIANYIIVDCSIDVTSGDYFVCEAPSYAITSEDFGYETSSIKFNTLYVVFGSEMTSAKQITRENAAKIFSSVPSAPDMDDDHEGHDH